MGTNEVTLVGGQTLRSTHRSTKCEGQPCCIHSPSDHHMLGWDQRFTGTMWRISPDGDWYPDPDDPFAPATPNGAECLNCHDIIYSLTVHDFKQCKCGEIMVDGGKSYQRRGWPAGKTPAESFRDITDWPMRP